jgi:hypothetical protein
MRLEISRPARLTRANGPAGFMEQMANLCKDGPRFSADDAVEYATAARKPSRDQRLEFSSKGTRCSLQWRQINP